MKNRHWILPAIIIFLSGCTTAQKSTPKELTYRVEDAPDWNSVFIRETGWFGAIVNGITWPFRTAWGWISSFWGQ